MGCDVCRELGLRQSHTRVQVVGDGVQQGARDTRIAAVHTLGPAHVQEDAPHLSLFDNRALVLKPPDGLIEHPAVVRLVRLYQRGAFTPRQGLL